jgi:integrase
MGSVRPRGQGRFILSYAGPNGRRVRPTIQAATRAEAERVLKQLEGELARGRPLLASANKVTFEDLAKDFITDYEVNGRRSVGKARKTVQKLGEVFCQWKATSIATPAIRSYIERRQRDGFSNGTINRDLAALKRMFSLAVKAKLLSHDHVPAIDLLKEGPPRAGFFEPEQFQAVLRHLRPEIRPVAKFAYEVGWRLREIINLQWRHLNLQEGYARLDPEMSKNREGRIAYLSPALLDVLRTQEAATRDLEREKSVIIPWVFHRRGRRILRFLASWQTACRMGGMPGMLFHDLRRTAIRNMVRAGVPERVAMQISGHKTRSVFERYNIVSEGDLQEAARKLAAYRDRDSNGLPQHDSQRQPVAGGPARRPTHHGSA